MREDVLRQYFLGDIPISVLAEDLRDSVTRVDDISSAIAIEDMRDIFVVGREHVILLCDAFLASTLDAGAINTLAFALIASDHFELNDDEALIEVLHDWSAPEINFPLNETTIKMHRDWLTGAAIPPQRSKAASTLAQGRLVSVRTKVKPAQALLSINSTLSSSSDKIPS